MKFQPRRPRNDEERILPLINVVFLLLVFFMLAGRIAASDPFEVTPPRSASEGAVQTRDLLVMVSGDGRLALDGKVMSESELASSVSAHLAANEAAQVRLKADGRAAATRVVAVMESLRRAGVERLDLLTVPERR